VASVEPRERYRCEAGLVRSGAGRHTPCPMVVHGFGVSQPVAYATGFDVPAIIIIRSLP
jgi:hypothetical protein